MNVAVAVSGGMDSLLAVALLREAGHHVLALHAHFLPPDEPARATAREIERACRAAGADFAVADLSAPFAERVVRPFVRAYAAGLTPNPCAACNPAMKFGLLLDAATERGCERFATGHYARIGAGPDGRPRLARGADPLKDQSYFLSLVPAERLARVAFPLAAVRKADVPGLLAARGLTPPLARESQEICFIPGDDYCAFLERSAARFGARLSGPGPIVLAPDPQAEEGGREIGRHAGLWRYTPGQRRGLGIAWSEPLYVIERDAAANRLVVGPAAALGADGCTVRDLNVLVPPEQWPARLLGRTRYRQQARPVRAELCGAGADAVLRLRFETPWTRPAPGQIAALYTEGGEVLVGGFLTGEIPQ
jgi:tRNA-specific 2-thiouridylase